MTQGFFSIFGEGALSLFGLGILSVFSNKLGKKSNEFVFNFLQRVSRITCSHIIFNHLTLNWKKGHPDERKFNKY